MSANLLGTADQLAKEGKLEESAAICRELLARDPGNVQALYLLGSVNVLTKKPEEGLALLERVVALAPSHLDALNNLGLVLLENRKDAAAAIECFKKIVELNPGYVNAFVNLGNVYLALNRLDEAERSYQQALALAPGNGLLLNNLGVIATRRGDRWQAISHYGRALDLLPDDPEILSNLITALRAVGDKEGAFRLMRRILAMSRSGAALFPAFAFAKMTGLWSEATAALPEILGMIRRGEASLSSFENMNLPLLASPEVDNETLFAVHRAAGKIIGTHKQFPALTPERKQPAATERIKVGYISPDFRRHVVNAFFRGIINSHDRERFEVYCYSNTRDEDEITEQYRKSADVFVNVADMSDWQLAETIDRDGIHILIDLAGYTQNGRVAMMDYRPAPVQALYLGYPYTSGLSSIDYFVSDPYLDGPHNARFFTEYQLRLPESFITFDRLHEQVIDPAVPLDRNGLITFGSMNNLYKLSPEVIRVWGKILNRVPDARLIVNHPNCDMEISRENIWAEFGKHGIARGRVSIIWQKHPGGSHLRYYNDFDVALDAFPLTGGTTTIDAAWMGVPVVTLVGEIYHQRLSYSILSNIGIDLCDLIAFTEDEYVEKAVALANNPERIRELHRAIPLALKASILCDPIRLTRHMEAAYVEAWNRKFPEHSVSLEVQEPIWFLPAPGGVQIAACNSLEDMDAYVLQEYVGWFEQEHPFVLSFLRAGMRVLDIGSEIGIYAIPVAAKIAPEGRLWAVAFAPRDGRLLRMSVEHNRMGNLDILIGGDRKLRLDAEMAREGLRDIDFVRISIDVRDDAILQDSHEFFSANSPLVMFSVKRDNSVVDTALAAIFDGYGYGIYRLVPGLGVLVPFAGDEELDAFAMNLFACKPDRAAALEEQGWLVRRMAPQAELPGTHVAEWQNYLAGLPYAAELLPGWLSAPDRQQDWEAYWVALNLFAQAKDAKREVARRCACLQTAGGILVMLAQSAPRLPRLLSLCRVLVELGRREAAVNVLNQLSTLFEEGKGLDVDEPFLALTDESAALRPGGRLAEWLFASVLEQREKLRAFSTFFTGQESLPALEAIRKTGFHSAETDRRIALIMRRHQGHVATA